MNQHTPIVPGTDPARPIHTDGRAYADTGEAVEIQHYADGRRDPARMHAGRGYDCTICRLPKATTRPAPVHYASRDLWGPWTPVGSVVIDGITVVPGARGLTGRYGAGLLAAYDRDQVNRRVRSVFELAQARRWELAQIQSPAVRDALSLT